MQRIDVVVDLDGVGGATERLARHLAAEDATTLARVPAAEQVTVDRLEVQQFEEDPKTVRRLPVGRRRALRHRPVGQAGAGTRDSAEPMRSSKLVR